MCNNNTPSVSLQTAVLMTVKEFAQNGSIFSIHDITRNVRDKVSAGSLEIPEVEVSGTSFRFDIPHVKVKALFLDMFNAGVFDPDFTLDRQFNNGGGYWEYKPQNVNIQASTQPVPTAAPSVAPATNSTYVTPAAVVSPVQAAVTQKVGKPEVTQRIMQYLSTCGARNFCPTIKQVQSAVKRGNLSSGWTCLDLSMIIETDLGFSIVDDPDFVSMSQVKV